MKKALDYSKESVSFYRKNRDSQSLAHSIRHQADIHYMLGNIPESQKMYEEAIQLYRNNKNSQRSDLANALRGYALMLELKGEKNKAIDVWQEARQLYENVGINEGVDEADQKLRELTG